MQKKYLKIVGEILAVVIMLAITIFMLLLLAAVMDSAPNWHR